MECWFEDQMAMLLSSGDKKSLMEGINKAVQFLGFEYYAYGLCIKLPITQPRYELINNYPPEWQTLYEERGYIKSDPTVLHAFKSTNPIVWEDSFFQGTEIFWEEANSYGLKGGWAQSSRLNQRSIGMLTVARSEEFLKIKELDARTPYLLWLNQVVQAGFEQLTSPSPHTESKNLLSNRETEVIKWCAEGKTSEEIGIILGISERTINFHTANVIKKLDTCNKTSAAVRALQLDIL